MSIFKTIIRIIGGSLLALAARGVIRRYKPTVVMVTGSVGKTSTKDAVAEVLMKRFLVRKSEKSFNSDFGVPLTILGVENPWYNPLAWLAVWRRAFGLLLLPNHYPTLLVLEVGSERPGDMAHILRIVTPHAVVVTALPPISVHVEAYASPEAVQEEEFSPAFALPGAAPLVIPIDDVYALRNAVRTPARVYTYGYSSDAQVRIGEGSFAIRDGIVAGMEAQVAVGEEGGMAVALGSVGQAQVLPLAAAIAVGTAFDIPLAESLEALSAYVPPPGRGRLLRGIRDSIVIDDSYNASPAAVEQALATLKAFPHAKRRIAVLGDMLELGRYSFSEHERIAALARDSADLVVGVGIRARAFTAASGSEALHYDTSYTAAEALPELVKPGDVILVKGSQSIRTERIAEALLADPADAAYLVRQERVWKRKT